MVAVAVQNRSRSSGDSRTRNAHPWLKPADGARIACSSKTAYLQRYAEPDKGWTDRDEARWPKPFWDMDAAMASLLILQTATDEGLASCFIGIPPERDATVRAAFGIPGDF
ncbi:MAG TPA: nitroreductase family protein, partial [Blastococcus sp.]